MAVLILAVDVANESGADTWSALLDLLVLLGTALVLGTIAERLRQSAILGYLVAGTLLGPNALAVLPSLSRGGVLEVVTEIGVALLLFTIGLEFSWQRLRRMGVAAIGGGALQVTLTIILTTAISLALGLSTRAAIVTGAIVALSSTATVLRLLVSRAEIESIHGRTALGILLTQDVAVIPLVLLVSVLSGGEGVQDIILSIVRTLIFATAMIGGFWLMIRFVLPVLLGSRVMQRNRELPILLAVIVGVGSAWIAHAVQISPAMGAFLAGMLMAESPYATQVRADVGSLRTLLMTLFFSSIGMLGDPMWAAMNWLPVVGVVIAIVVGKAGLIWVLLRLLRQSHVHALAAGICLAQAGEFSFVLALQARGSAIDEHLFSLLLSATIATLFLTPFMVVWAEPLASRITWLLRQVGWLRTDIAGAQRRTTGLHDHVVLIGFGPAGQAVGETLLDKGDQVAVIDLNHKAIIEARRLGFTAEIGDATHGDVLEHLHVQRAKAVVITIPDPISARTIIRMVSNMTDTAVIIARARYHVYRMELEYAGAEIVIDEELQVGRRLAAAVRSVVRTGEEPTEPSVETADDE